MDLTKFFIIAGTIFSLTAMTQIPSDDAVSSPSKLSDGSQRSESENSTLAAELDASVDEGQSAEDHAALLLGKQVLAVQQAIENPSSPESMAAVKALGHDQRYYVLVRGWLSYQLQADRSILNSVRDGENEKIKSRAAFLEKAIRAIDLE